MSCLALFLDAARRGPTRPALIDGTGAVTYDELRARADRCAGRLARAGLRGGDRVVVLVPMSVDLYAWLIGLLWLDVTVVFVEPWMPLPLLERCLERVQPRALLASPLGIWLATRVPAFRRIPSRFATRGGAFARWLGWATPPAPAGPVPPPAAHRDDAAVLTFTTGSSGLPKGVVRTHGLLVHQHHVLSRSLRLTPDDVCLHAFANFILNNLAVGAASVIPPLRPSQPTRFSPARLFRSIVQAGVTSIVCPPASLERLVAYCEARSLTAPSVRGVGTGGAPVSTRLLERTARVFPTSDPEILYGSSEAEPVSHLHLSELRTLRGEGACVGRPVDEALVRLGEDGEIQVSGPHVSTHYFEDPETTAAVKVRDADGRLWHRMGDVARLDEAGRLWLTGRLHAVIRTATGPLHPLPLETRAAELPHVVGAALVGVGPIGSARAVLAVQPVRWTPDAFAGWTDELKRLLPAVSEVRFLRQLPRDRRHQSKLDYARLRELLELPS